MTSVMTLKNFLKKRIAVFIFAFVIMAAYLLPLNDMFAGSGDANETWQVVKTFFDSEPYSSYIMYKGFLAVIPNLIFYQLALFFNTNEFLFLKIFNCLAFSYIATIGIPYLFSYIFNKKIKNTEVFILTIVLFLGIKKNFSFISIDAPSIMVLFLALNSAIRISISKQKLPLWYYIYTGAIFSMCTSFSGQYLPAVICVILYLVFFKIIPMFIKREIGMRLLAALICFCIGFSTINYANTYFIDTRVQPVRDAGGWLPTGEEWLKYRVFGHGLLNTKSGSPVSIPDNRGKAILIKENVDIHTIELGGIVLDFHQFINLVLKHPLDFIIRWLNKLFLGISIDGGSVSSSYLFVTYTLLFLSFLTLKRNCQRIKDIFTPKAFLILGLITPSLVPCLMHVEMRYFMSIQILIAGSALLSGVLWNMLSGFKERITHIRSSSISIGQISINYTLIAYLIFLCLCFMLIGSLYEISGPLEGILFRL